LNPLHVSAPVPTVLIPIDIEDICDTPLGTTKLRPELANWLFMLWKLVVALNPASVLVTTIAILMLLLYQARTFIGPREAKIGDPRENDLTAALAKNAPIKVLVIACLFDFADFDKVVNPVLRSPAINDFIADPAEVCSKRAKAAPVSITLIPNWRGALRLLALRLRTMLTHLWVAT
jgi:hypothetical protein